MKKVFMLASALFIVGSLAISIAAPALACTPNTDVGISVSVPNPVPYGADVTLTITEENTGTWDAPLTNVSVELFKDSVLIHTFTAPPASGDSSNTGTLDPGEIWAWDYDVTNVTANTTYTVIGHGYYGGNDITFDTGYGLEKDFVDITVTENGGGEGFTPGYWRNHLEDWPAAYDPTDTFNGVFGVGPDIPLGARKTGAIWAKGGGENALVRHATAALLNAAHDNIEYAFTEAEIIAMVQAAYASGDFNTAKDLLAEQNELEGDISS